MNLKIRQQAIKADVLIIGGGIGGLQAAISAAENGASVIVAEKANVKRSGNGSTGNDHFVCYIPEVHGNDIKRAMTELKATIAGPNQDEIMQYTLLSATKEVVDKWSSYGINMKPTGEYHFEGHTLRGRQHYHLKYDGRNQKECLAREAKKRGAVFNNHVIIHEILTNNEHRVIGAVGIDISEDIPELIVYQVKAAILATGPNARIFPPSVPAYLFNINECPACTGGAVIGYRAGARLINYDLINRHSGPKYFERGGKATWIGRLSNSDGSPVSPLSELPTREYGDPIMDMWPGIYSDKFKDGSGPVYMNCSVLSEEDLEYMKYCFSTEGITSVSDYLDQKNIDLRKSIIEFGPYGKKFGHGGLDVTPKGETSVKGLYAAGTVIGNVRGGISQAAVFGMISGQNAAEYVKTAESEAVENHPLIAQTSEFINKLLSRENGGSWHEVNAVLQQIMADYIGCDVKSETILGAGLKYIRDLRQSAYDEIKCSNSHELMRTLEVFDLLDLCEAAALMIENRKESRGKNHVRTDYRFTNPLLNEHFQTIEKVNGEIKMNFRKNIHIGVGK